MMILQESSKVCVVHSVQYTIPSLPDQMSNRAKNEFKEDEELNDDLGER